MANQGEARRLELTYRCAPYVRVTAPRTQITRRLELTYRCSPYIADKPPTKKVVVST